MDSPPSSAPEGSPCDVERYASENLTQDRAVLGALLPLVPAACAEALKCGDPMLAYGLVREASSILCEIRDALAPPGIADAYYGRLWQHPENWPDPHSLAAYQLDKGLLEHAAAGYLSRPWMSSGELDWVLVDALSRHEILAYEAHIARELPPPRGSAAWWVSKTFLVGLPLLVELAIAVGTGLWLWHEYGVEAPYRTWWAVAAAAYYVWWLSRAVWTLPARRRAKTASRKVLRATAEQTVTMRRCYNELQGPLLDPSRVRDALLTAEKLEVRWSRATWPLLDNAISRPPPRWVPGP